MTISLQTEVPGPRSRALMAERQAAVARGPFHVTPVFIARGDGAVLEDVDGNRFIDFAAGLAVLNAGQLAASVAEAVRRQSRDFLHACFHVTPYEGYVRLCAALNRLAPGDFPKKSFLANSGAEAVENAVKIARAATASARMKKVMRTSTSQTRSRGVVVLCPTDLISLDSPVQATGE